MSVQQSALDGELPVGGVTELPPTGTAALTGRIARGDPNAVAEFYREWFDRTYAMARSISRRDESFCLDVVQDCMLRVVRSMRRLPDERAVQAWMTRVIFTTVIDRLRKETRLERRERRAAQPESRHASEDPGDAVEEQDRLRWIRERLAELPERDRRLILARFAGERSLAAIGLSLGMTGNAAHGRIRRILQRLRGLAEEVFGD